MQIGEEFDVHQTLGLMEAMKVFESLSLEDFNTANGEELFPEDHIFVITRIFAESGQTVNQGDLLFIVKPSPQPAAAARKRAVS